MKVQFRVKADVPDTSRMGVFVVGDLPELGGWSAANAVPLYKTPADASGRPGSGSSVWCATVEIGEPAPQSMQYRYVMGLLRQYSTSNPLSDAFGSLSIEDRAPKLDSVHTWEANLLPRVLELASHAASDAESHDAVTATYGRYDGATCVERGWLTDGQSEIHIRIHGNDPIQMYGRSWTTQYQIRCVPIDLSSKRADAVEPTTQSFEHHDSGVSLSDLAGSLSSDDEPGRSFDTRAKSKRLNDPASRDRPAVASDVTVSTILHCDGMRRGGGTGGVESSHRSFPRIQPEAGVPYRAGDFLTFRLRTRRPQDVAFRIIVTMLGGAKGGGVAAEGSVFVMQLPGREGGEKVIQQCIVSSQQEVLGTLSLDLLVVNPSPHAPSLREGHLAPSLPSKRPLFIGHRGMGSSFSAGARLARVRENTLASFQEAFAHGVDMVEFDVVLSKDRVPVIYHDFVTLVHATADGNKSGKIDSDDDDCGNKSGKSDTDDEGDKSSEAESDKKRDKKRDEKRDAKRDAKCDTKREAGGRDATAVDTTSSPPHRVRVAVQDLTLAELKALDFTLVAEWRHDQDAAAAAAAASAPRPDTELAATTTSAAGPDAELAAAVAAASITRPDLAAAAASAASPDTAAASAEREKQRHDSGFMGGSSTNTPRRKGAKKDSRNDSAGTGKCAAVAEQHFPTLRECFESVDPRCGFNVEVKHAMALAAGGLDEDVMLAIPRNDYVDAVLAVVFDCAGDRTVVFSSFDPDVCLMLRLKQARYPVLLLSQGATGRPAYADLRACSIEAGVLYALSEGLRGVDVCSRELVADPGIVRRAKERGVEVYCWGSENNSRENIKLLGDSGVDGIILDKCDEFIDGVA